MRDLIPACLQPSATHVPYCALGNMITETLHLNFYITCKEVRGFVRRSHDWSRRRFLWCVSTTNMNKLPLIAVDGFLPFVCKAPVGFITKCYRRMPVEFLRTGHCGMPTELLEQDTWVVRGTVLGLAQLEVGHSTSVCNWKITSWYARSQPLPIELVLKNPETHFFYFFVTTWFSTSFHFIQEVDKLQLGDVGNN